MLDYCPLILRIDTKTIIVLPLPKFLCITNFNLISKEKHYSPEHGKASVLCCCLFYEQRDCIIFILLAHKWHPCMMMFMAEQKK